MKVPFVTIGGAPIVNDYLQILQAGTIEALGALLSSFGANIVLQGCQVSISGTTHTITSGWVFYNNEVIKVPAHSWEAASTGFFGGLPNTVAYVEVIEVPNLVPYANGTNHPISKETILKFKEFTTEISPVYYFDFKKLGTAIANILQPVFTQDVVATSGSGFTFASGVSSGGGAALTVRKRIDKTLIISGYAGGLDVTAATISGVPNCKLILTLDAAYRPASKVFFTAVTGLSGANSDIPITNFFVLFPDGKLCLIQASTAFNAEVTFNTAVVTLI